jgi:glutamate-1-semialdehyde 2,1-aminomutase
VYKTLEKSSEGLAQGLREAAQEAGIPTTINRVGSMFTTFFTDQKVKDFASAKTSDTVKFGNFFRAMLKSGVNLAPSQFEAAFISLAHTRADLTKTIEAARKSMKSL